MKDKIKIAIDAMNFFKDKLHNGIYGEFVGNFDTAISALEKQIPKKVVKHNGSELYHCPNCDTYFLGNGFKHCTDCGQALDWGDKE